MVLILVATPELTPIMLFAPSYVCTLSDEQDSWNLVKSSILVSTNISDSWSRLRNLSDWCRLKTALYLICRCIQQLSKRRMKFLLFLTLCFTMMSSNSFWNSSCGYFLYPLLVGATGLFLILLSSLQWSKKNCIKVIIAFMSFKWNSFPC